MQCFEPVIDSSVHLGAFFFSPENKLIGYADDSTLSAVSSPGVRVTVTESLMRDLGNISEWCDLLGMKLNVSKTKILMVSMSRTMHLQSPPINDFRNRTEGV